MVREGRGRGGTRKFLVGCYLLFLRAVTAAGGGNGSQKGRDVNANKVGHASAMAEPLLRRPGGSSRK